MIVPELLKLVIFLPIHLVIYSITLIFLTLSLSRSQMVVKTSSVYIILSEIRN